MSAPAAKPARRRTPPRHGRRRAAASVAAAPDLLLHLDGRARSSSAGRSGSSRPRPSTSNRTCSPTVSSWTVLVPRPEDRVHGPRIGSNRCTVSTTCAHGSREPEHLRWSRPDARRRGGPGVTPERHLDGGVDPLRDLVARGVRQWVCLLFDEGPEVRVPLTEPLGVWHVAIPDVPVGQRYGFRVDGAWIPRSATDSTRPSCCSTPTRRRSTARSGHPSRSPHDGDPDSREHCGLRALRAPRRRRRRRVRLGCRHPAAHGVGRHRHLRAARQGLHPPHPGSPSSCAAPTPGSATRHGRSYLSDLGVTAVELLPVHQFDAEPSVDAPRADQLLGLQPDRLLRPARRLRAARRPAGSRSRSSGRWSRRCTGPGIEVILDVVYNHTAEGDETGPTLSLPRARQPRPTTCCRRTGRDVRRRHRLRQHRQRRPPGGAAADPGLPALLGRGDARRRLPLRPGLRAGPRRGHDVDMRSAVPRPPSSRTRCSRHVKLIAEPWDAARRLPGRALPAAAGRSGTAASATTCGDFWRGARRAARASSPRGSPARPDLYADDGRAPYASINFVTAHDGFTLRDLVSYDHKHNEANGEGNRDGTDDNRSWNCGVEGETDDPRSVALRAPAGRNLLATLCSCQRRADDHRRRRAGPHPARQQQRLLPGQRDLLVRLATGRRLARHPRDHQDGLCVCDASTLLCGSVTTSSDGRRSRAGPRTCCGCTRTVQR